MSFLEKILNLKVMNEDFKPRWLHKVAKKVGTLLVSGHYVLALIKYDCHSERDPLLKEIYFEMLNSGNHDYYITVRKIWEQEEKFRIQLGIE